MTELSHEFKLRGQSISMSFGMLSECIGVVKDPANVPMAAIVPEIREALIRTLLSKRDDKGKIVEEFNAFASDYTVKEMIELLDWAMKHVLDFFLNALQSATALTKESEDKMKDLVPSQDGSKS